MPRKKPIAGFSARRAVGRRPRPVAPDRLRRCTHDGGCQIEYTLHPLPLRLINLSDTNFADKVLSGRIVCPA
jgi:hypothetical protein